MYHLLRCSTHLVYKLFQKMNLYIAVNSYKKKIRKLRKKKKICIDYTEPMKNKKNNKRRPMLMLLIMIFSSRCKIVGVLHSNSK